MGLGLLEWLLIVIMDHSRKFPAFSTSKNMAMGTPDEEIWRFSSLISHRNKGWIFPPSLMKPEGHHWFVMGVKPSTHGHISWEILVTTPTVKDQLEHPRNWCFSQNYSLRVIPTNWHSIWHIFWQYLAFYLASYLARWQPNKETSASNRFLEFLQARKRNRHHRSRDFSTQVADIRRSDRGQTCAETPLLQCLRCGCLCMPQQVRSGLAKCFPSHTLLRFLWGCVRFCVLANLPKPNPGWTVHNPVSCYLQVWYCNSFIRNHLQAIQYSITKMTAVSTSLPLIHHHEWILAELYPTYHLCNIL